MTQLLTEVQAIQNPALGAVLIWRFSCGYEGDEVGRGTPLPLAFIALPIVLHAKSAAEVLSTQAGSGLRKFQDKFDDRVDLVFAIHRRMLNMRDLTLRSLRIALRSRLVSLTIKDATLHALTSSKPQNHNVQDLLKAAERLGKWCGDLSLFEISGILKVEI